MSDSSCSTSNPLPAETINNLEFAKEAAHAYASENGFAIAMRRSDKWGYPSNIRKVWTRFAQGGHHRIRSSEELAHRQSEQKSGLCIRVCPSITKEKWTIMRVIRFDTAPYSRQLA